MAIAAAQPWRLNSARSPSPFPTDSNCMVTRFSTKRFLFKNAHFRVQNMASNAPSGETPIETCNRSSSQLIKTCQSFGWGLSAAAIVLFSSFDKANAVSPDALLFQKDNFGTQNPEIAFTLPFKPFEQAPNRIATLASTTSQELESNSTTATPNTSKCDISLNGVESSTQTEEKISDLGLVKEAWGVVKESFFDARNNKWNEEGWEEVLRKIEKSPPTNKREAYSMISTMVGKLKDPFSRFITPDQFAQLAKYDITGIGLNISEAIDDEQVPSDDNIQIKIKVVGIILDSPAYLAGIRQGDEILAVNDKAVDGLSAFEVSSLIQGPKGTTISLKVKNLCGDVQSYALTRNTDAPSTPVYFRLEKNNPNFEKFAKNGDVFGYIKLKEFNSLAKKDLAIAIQKLESQGANSFILDLRDNPGGLVQAGVEISRMFLDEGSTIISIEGRSNSNKRSIVSDGNKITNAPLIVLVNNRTASASEIVSAALHDNCRAILIGKKTYGKGLIQSVYELSDGSGLIITVGKYVTPSSNDIDNNGITPDFSRFPDRDSLEQKTLNCKVPNNSRLVFEAESN